MGKLRVAIVGVGNCASSLVQGRYYYENAKVDDFVPGLMHVSLGGYHVRDIEFVAAFDVDAKKVGRDLSEAIRSGENNTIQFADVPPLGVEVQRGPSLDGLGHYYAETIHESDAAPVDVAVALGPPAPTCSSATCRSAPRRPPASTPSRPSRPAWPS
jgi:myo-inositol-1-phosphate synthase